MSEEKDFLSQLASEIEKPDSFKEEERVPIVKERKPIKPWMIIAPIIVLVIALVGIWFFFLRAKIEMPDFVNKTQEDVAKWVKQYEIEASGIIFDEEYSMEYDKGKVMSQTMEAGKKVKTNVKINFGLSLGPNPDEKLSVPDIKTMTKSELDAWVKENKLLNTKITTKYSDEVKENEVIDFEFKGCKEDEFTRGCQLNISVSKGEAPAGQVAVSNFKDKSYIEVEEWANKNKINLKKVEAFDSKVTVGNVIRQSVEDGKTMKQGDTLTVYVSLGKGIKVPDLTEMSKSEAQAWIEDNRGIVRTSERYSYGSYVISQSVKPGTYVGEDAKIDVVVSLGDTFSLELGDLVGQHYTVLEEWRKDAAEKGIRATIYQTDEESYSGTYKAGQIMKVRCTRRRDNKEYDCNGVLPIDVDFEITVAKGKVVKYKLDTCASVFDLVDLLSANGIDYSFNDVDESYVAYLVYRDAAGNFINVNDGDYLYSDRTYIIKTNNQELRGCGVTAPITPDNPDDNETNS